MLQPSSLYYFIAKFVPHSRLRLPYQAKERIVIFKAYEINDNEGKRHDNRDAANGKKW